MTMARRGLPHKAALRAFRTDLGARVLHDGFEARQNLLMPLSELGQHLFAVHGR